MELKYNPVKKLDNASFFVERRDKPYYGVNWHYHEEFELIIMIKGQGVRIVGDNMDHFNNKEMVLMAGGLPHLFKNDLNLEDDKTDYIIVRFTGNYEGFDLFSLPEFKKISQLLKKSNRGIIFKNIVFKSLKKELIELTEAEGAKKYILLLKVLDVLANEENYKLLASEEFALKHSVEGGDRTQSVIDYIANNYTKDLSLDDLSKVACMTTNSFCRYFKNRTGKTAFQFIREYRVNKACQMLINGEKSISEICFDTGFNSFSSFNRIFKSLKDVSASEYKNRYLELNKQ